MIRRHLFAAASAISLLICLATVIAWVRSNEGDWGAIGTYSLDSFDGHLDIQHPVVDGVVVTRFHYWCWAVASSVVPLLWVILRWQPAARLLRHITSRTKRRWAIVAGIVIACGIGGLWLDGVDQFKVAVGWGLLIFTCTVVFGVILLVCFWGVLSLVMEAFLGPAKRRLRKRMKASGRFLQWSEVAQHLTRGEGTLIYHWTLPHSVWWTEDDLMAVAPTALPDAFEMDGETGPLVDYAKFCMGKYLDEETGLAKLTVPLRGVESEGSLLARYPHAKIVDVTSFGTIPVISRYIAKPKGDRSAMPSAPPDKSPRPA